MIRFRKHATTMVGDTGVAGSSRIRRLPKLLSIGSWVAASIAVALVAGTAVQAYAQSKSVGVALVGPRNDRSYNQSVYEGATKAKDAFGLKLSVVDHVSDPTAQIDTIRVLAQNNDYVVAGSTSMATAVERLAPDFADTQFVVVGGRAKSSKNVHFIDVDPRQGGYIIGAAAAKVSKTKIVGFIGGMLIPPTTETEAGFKLGVKAADPSVTIKTVIVGSFDDAVKAKQAAAAQIAAGADVLFGWLDAAYPGVVQAIRDSGKDVKAIGVATSKCDIGKENLGDHILAYGAATYNLMRDFAEGREIKNVTYGVQDSKVQGLKLCPGHDKPELRTVISEATKAVVSGAVKLR